MGGVLNTVPNWLYQCIKVKFFVCRVWTTQSSREMHAGGFCLLHSNIHSAEKVSKANYSVAHYWHLLSFAILRSVISYDQTTLLLSLQR